MNDNTFLQIMGARIRSELNDLKRTPQACALELGMEEGAVLDVLEGKCAVQDAQQLIDRIAEYYPVDKTDLQLSRDDCTHGIKIMRAQESAASSRIFNRPDRTGERRRYYEYRDTAMSRMSQIKPEWIKELRVVSDSDPHNPDVSYNNGHFLHQVTFFLGPVNFYYEIEGRRFCVEMNTGDSNYIMPFFKHSFASRSADETALIIAVTFGGSVRRAQKELYALGERGLKYLIEGRSGDRRGEVQLIKQHMGNEKMTPDHLREIVKIRRLPLCIDALFDPQSSVPYEQLRLLAEVLNVQVYDLMMPAHKPDEDVLIKHYSRENGYDYPSAQERRYQIHPLVRNAKMPLVKGFDLTVLGSPPGQASDFEHSLHAYVYNFGDSAVGFDWADGASEHRAELHPGDSLYLSPFIKHSFSKVQEAGRLLVVLIPGAVDLSTQREMSCFAHGERLIRESQQWFD